MLSINAYTFILILVVLIFGIVTGQKASVSKNSFSSILIGSLILGQFMIDGYTWYDEFYLAGALVPIYARRKKLGVKFSFRSNFALNLFFLFCIFETFRGIYFFKDLEGDYFLKIRWIVFFILLILITSILRSRDILNTILSTLQLTVILFFLLIYFITNAFAALKYGSAGYAQYAQSTDQKYLGAIWANTAYSTPTLFVFLAIGVIELLQSKSRSRTVLSVLVIFLTTSSYGLTLSRSGMILSLVIVITLLLVKSQLKTFYHLCIVLIFVIAGFFIGTQISSINSGDTKVLENLYCESVNVLISCENVGPREIGIGKDREIQFSRSFEYFSNSGITTKLLGTGNRTSGYLLADFFGDPKGSQYAMGFAPIFLIEFGLIGMCFMFFILKRSLKVFWHSRDIRDLFTILILGGVLATTLVVNIYDFIPFYLLLSLDKDLGLVNSINTKK